MNKKYIMCKQCLFLHACAEYHLVTCMHISYWGISQFIGVRWGSLWTGPGGQFKWTNFNQRSSLEPSNPLKKKINKYLYT